MSNDTSADGTADHSAFGQLSNMLDRMDAFPDTDRAAKAANGMELLSGEIRAGNLPVETALLIFNAPEATFATVLTGRMSAGNCAALLMNHALGMLGYDMEVAHRLLRNCEKYAREQGIKASITTH